MRDLIYKLNYIFTKKQKIRIFQLMIIITIGAFVELVGVSAILPFINVLLEPDIILRNPVFLFVYNFLHLKSANDFMVLLAALLILAYIVKNIYVGLMYDAQFRFVYRNQRRLSTKMLQCYLRQDYEFHLHHNSSELIRNINNDVAMFFAAVLACLQLITETMVCMIFVLFLFIKDKTFTIGMSIVLLFFVLVFMKIYRRKSQKYGEQTRKGYANMTKWQMQSFGGIKEIKIANCEEFFVNNFNQAYIDYAESQRKYQLMNMLPRPMMEAVCISGLLCVVIFKLMRGVNLSYFMPTLALFAVAAVRLMPSFTRITNYINAILFNGTVIDSVYHNLMAMNQLEKAAVGQQRSAEAIPFSQAIYVENLSFAYEGANENILENVNLYIPKNKSAAFIGPSGAGKTTLANLILGVLNPQSGKILIDNINISNHKKGWYSKLGYIPQTIYIMDDTLRKNIAFGVPEEDIDDERVKKVLREAQLADFSESLEYGINTMIGEDGTRLSGGQRQRIGIARALYREPEVLVLDEATSALDNETEAAVMEAIDSLAGKKTVIIIAHRLSTIKNCDFVYKVDHKKVEQVNADTDLE